MFVYWGLRARQRQRSVCAYRTMIRVLVYGSLRWPVKCEAVAEVLPLPQDGVDCYHPTLTFSVERILTTHTSPKAPRPITFRISKASRHSRSDLTRCTTGRAVKKGAQTSALGSQRQIVVLHVRKRGVTNYT